MRPTMTRGLAPQSADQDAGAVRPDRPTADRHLYLLRASLPLPSVRGEMIDDAIKAITQYSRRCKRGVVEIGRLALALIARTCSTG